MPHAPSGRHGKTESAVEAPPFWPMPTADMWPQMMGGLRSSNKFAAEAVSEMNREWLEFLNRRLQQDLALPQRLASCKGVAEAWGIYAEFSQTALNDYLEEFAELTRMRNSAANASRHAMQDDLGAAGRNTPRDHARN